MPSMALGWAGWLLLAWSGDAAAGVLYRCADGQHAPRWQDRPCAAGERQRTLEYVPEPTQGRSRSHSPAPARPSVARGRSLPSRATGPAPARRDPRRERALAACAQARSLAAERTDVEGNRVPVRVIRARERRADRACHD